MSADAVRWQDAAALGAALFLNAYSLLRFAFPLELSASLPKLAALAIAVSLVTTLGFYLGGRGGAQTALSSTPLETLLGRLLYISALLSLLAPLGVWAALTISEAFLQLFAELAGYRSLAWHGPTSFGEQLILLAWAAWVASRGRAVVAASARLWAFAFLIFLLGGCIGFWRQVSVFMSAQHRALYWSDVASSLTDAAAVVLPLSFLASLCRRGDREPVSGASSLLLGAGVGLMVILGCISLAGLSLRSPEDGFLLFLMLGRSAVPPYGEGRWLIVTLTMLPLMRIAALAFTESFASFRVPYPALAGFGCLAAFALASHEGWEIWEAMYAGTFLSSAAAGVLCGKGMTAVLTRRNMARPQRRAAEIFGMGAGLIVAGAAQVELALGLYAPRENQPLAAYVAVFAVTWIVGLAWPASPKSPGMSGQLRTDALS
jgi:hypothetical protein